MANTLKCDWCGHSATDIGPSYGSYRIARCDQCAHEWQYVPAPLSPSGDPCELCALKRGLVALRKAHRALGCVNASVRLGTTDRWTPEFERGLVMLEEELRATLADLDKEGK